MCFPLTASLISMTIPSRKPLRMTQLSLSTVAILLFTLSPLQSAHAVEDGDGEVIRGIETIPELDCVIEPSEIVDVGVALPGVVQSILADRSDLIKKGEVLVKMDNGVELAAAELAKARSKLDTAINLRKETAAFGDLTQKRNQQLFKKSAISIQEMDQLKTETRVAKLQVQQEKDNKRIAELQYRRARAVLNQRTIRSPFDGVVMDRFKAVGEYVDDEPLLRVAKLNPLNVEVIIPVVHLGKVKPGMTAEVSSLFSGEEDYVATVERVDTVADTASGTYGVRLSLENPDHKIPAGLRCQLSFLPEPEKKGKPQHVADIANVVELKSAANLNAAELWKTDD